MSSVWDTFRRMTGMSPEGQGERSKTERRIGPAKQSGAYYGNQASSAIAGRKHDGKAMLGYLRDQGAVKVKGKYDKLPSASGQLLGGGG